MSLKNTEETGLGETDASLQDFLMAALESLVPGDVEVYLQMNSSRFSMYGKMRNEVMACAKSRTGARFRESQGTEA